MRDGDFTPPTDRSFLFLQNLATPFFVRLGDALAARGHAVHRINLNGGDRLFWPRPGTVDYRGAAAEWPAAVDSLLVRRGVTDLVLFGDCRPAHRAAIAAARARGVAVHVFEEAYLRPGWITLERDGVNALSRLPRDPAWFRAEAAALPPLPSPRLVPASFRRRALDDIRYNLACGLGRWRFPHWETHRPWRPAQEYLGWALRGLRRPVRQAASGRAVRRLAAGAPFHLFPLQLEGDYQIREHSPFASVREAVGDVVASFARAAPAGTRLVIKGHPLDNGLIPWGQAIRRAARANGVADRVDYVAEAPFGPLLDACRAVVTVNSTAGLQALTAGRPVAVLGKAIYDLPGLTWQDDGSGLDGFWTGGTAPDPALLDAFLRVLVARCLIPGGFFSEPGIALGVAAAVERLEAEAPAARLLASAVPMAAIA
ncbi:capsular biosynthesis protein [Roseomonas sp. NAR14]|uniref:Capsular biosynthesis protein n=1 Tax=Roseomonas acroporae TaxID=2937791 RepID=A0A9X1Y9H2_9PROT|nr:capsular biosynthesis protein [Roseomonas acroporae]MCK8784592.1 capsular biosynthesis protein [Roseomonas acroporae]